MNYNIKSAHLLLGAMLMLSACSQDEEPACVNKAPLGAGERILFRTSLPGVTSRAQILTEDILPYFHVTAFNPYDGNLISSTPMQEHFAYKRIDILEGEDKHSSEECIWPEAGQESDELTFFAFYPELPNGATLANNSAVSGGSAVYDYRLENFRVADDIADQIDFVTAYTTGTMAEHLFSGITLPFCHQLSRIEVKAWSANKSCDIEIAGIRLGGVGVKGTFAFKPNDTAGEWDGAPSERGIVEYIFREEDAIVSLPNVAKSPSTATSAGAVSIMGNRRKDGNDNCAMLVPTTDTTGWNVEDDRRNADNKMYISVLLRVTDITPTAGINPKDPQRYPYRDLSQGANSPKIEVIYFAVNTADQTIATRLYKKEDGTAPDTYFTDKDCEDAYTLTAGQEIKEFGWAALPISASWSAGNIYTYILDYTSGVGVHDPSVAQAAAAPNAGDPVISDRVGISYTLKEWEPGGGAEFSVPGS